MSTPDVERLIRDKAKELGFDVVGFARADEPLGVEHDRYQTFIERGMHGSMAYLAEYVEVRRRLDTAAILEGAKSVICVGRRYARPREDEQEDPPLARTIARYARGQDYHLFLRKKLRKLAEFVRGLGPSVEARPLCDIEPVMERAWATRAGLGFVGKNGLVIVPGQGSFLLLGEVVTTLALTPGIPMAERCGACTRCLDACPTNAFAAPFVLDARRCISYLTIEQYEAPPEELREAIGEHLFGCDDCQDVCPYNRTAAPDTDRTKQFHPLERWSELSVGDLVSITEQAFPNEIQGTPLRRARRGGLARNAALVAANRLSREPLGQSADEHRQVLVAASKHDDPATAEIGVWGLLRASPASSTNASPESGADVEPECPHFPPKS